MEIQHRHFMKEKDATRLLTAFSESYKINIKQLLGSSINLEQADAQGIRVFFLNGELLLAKIDEQLFPTLAFRQLFSHLPKIVVDMGAVQHVCNGADVMAPGVVRINGRFSEQDLILVVDERHETSLALAIALVDSTSIKSFTRKRVAKNVHYVGDKLWKTIKRT